jgi:hypothetical protein
METETLTKQKRNYLVSVPLTAIEKATITKNAQVLGLAVASFMRLQALRQLYLPAVEDETSKNQTINLKGVKQNVK